MRARYVFRPGVLLGLAIALLSCVLWAGLIRSAFGSGPSELLPNLVADPPDNVSLATDSSSGTSRLLLRFNGYVHNVGPGALDFRGAREAPKVSQATTKEVEYAREHEQSLSQKTEEELASPAMKVTQRLFTTSAEETNIERPHIDKPSASEMIYVSADGHHHWHLQRVAAYSLWNASKTAEVAPAQKVGFCLEDSQHVETNIGPAGPVYADKVPPYRDFCQQYRPNATSLYEGISPGWRDLYDRELAFQWVDSSNVLPGEYWLREDVNPLEVIDEAAAANTPAYADSPTVIPGFDALPQATATEMAQPLVVALASTAWGTSRKATYTIVSAPQHGVLSAIAGNHVTYTPQDGYSGPDSFTFAASDPSSQFPLSPAIATVSISIGEGPLAARVAIGGAPASMLAGTSVQLSATVVNDSPTVTWSASAGSIGSNGLYTAPATPPPGGAVTVIASSFKGAHDQRTIEIQPVPAPQPAPEIPQPTSPSASGPSNLSHRNAPGVFRPHAMLLGRTLIMSTSATVAGRIRLSAYIGELRIGTCVTETPARRGFTCRVKLASSISARARIRVLASLRLGKRILSSTRGAGVIPTMSTSMRHTMALAARRSTASWQLVCGPLAAHPPVSLTRGLLGVRPSVQGRSS